MTHRPTPQVFLTFVMISFSFLVVDGKNGKDGKDASPVISILSIIGVVLAAIALFSMIYFVVKGIVNRHGPGEGAGNEGGGSGMKNPLI